MTRWRIRILGIILILPAFVMLISMCAVLTVAHMRARPLPEPQQVGDNRLFLVVSHEVHFEIHWLVFGCAIFVAVIGIACVIMSFLKKRPAEKERRS